jgi:phage N-6-adenine-methyltransferase
MTPPELIAFIVRRFGPIDLDLAANHDNALCKRYFTDDGAGGALNPKVKWECGRGYFNPPFNLQEEFCKKAEQETRNGNAQRIIGLLPANTLGNQWWFPLYDRVSRIILLNPRVQYIPHPESKKKAGGANGPSMLVEWHDTAPVCEKIRLERWK